MCMYLQQTYSYTSHGLTITQKERIFCTVLNQINCLQTNFPYLISPFPLNPLF